ncbi:hypothetical protein C5O00_00405 [Pukyongia salina]|uniref:Uncharacterized protein n=1 Tax=Pukyongia salina TaxID=2094025 RepID=A0A2S0HSR0_9FLAO|nr:hypothetical protein [Pukyongia salina]AVI49707.1 hypothetical protein C5O00_00405 [Pukyongia salina]
MPYTEKPEIAFYQKIGELFYAIAAADKVVREVEYKALKKLVREIWSKFDSSTDDFDSQAIYQMEIVFDWFDYERMDADSCFESFENYIKENPKLFTTERKELIYYTANEIAAAFSGKNKSELIMLGKLHLLLEA